MKDVTQSKPIREICEITKQMFINGWHEKNSGNISYRIFEEEIADFIPEDGYKNEIVKLDIDASLIANQFYIVTGKGKYFKNIYKDPELTLGIIKISSDGKSYQIIWGYRDGKGPTSEINAHLLTHIERQKIDPENRVVMHAHPSNTLAMSFIHDLNERSFTRTLWKMCTEAIVVFPEGVSVLDWMVCGTKEIGEATALKIRETRIVVWALHGVFVVGKTLDDAFGLIETVEKSAQIYILTKNSKIVNELSDDKLRALTKFFNVKVRDNYLGE